MIELLPHRNDRGHMFGAFISDELEIEGLYNAGLLNWLKASAETMMRDFLALHSPENVEVKCGNAEPPI
jgi:hypothetical protein